jgi:spermidine/putrescine-binding protein
MYDARLGRRQFLTVGAAAALGLVAGGCGSGSGTASSTTPAVPIDQEPGSLEVFTWAGYDNPALYPGYTPAYKKPTFTTEASDAQSFAKISTGYRPDISHPCVNFLPDYVTLGVLQPWDLAQIPNFQDLSPSFTRLGQIGGKQYLIPIDWGFESVLYRSDKVQPQRNSWALLYDPRYKGRISWADNPVNLVIAGYVNHVRDPWDMSDDELAKMQAFLISKKGLVRSLWGTQTEWEADIASGNIWIAGTAWPDSLLRLKKKHVPVTYMDPVEGRWSWVCGMVLYADTKESHHAHKFVNSYVSRDSAEWMVNNISYGRANTNMRVSKLDKQVVKAFDLDNLNALQGSNVQFYKHLRRRGVYGRIWDQIKAA